MQISSEDAKKLVGKKIRGSTVQACVPYKGDFLLRVKHHSADEADFDPFYLVKSETGEVQEFSVMDDGDPLEIAKAFETV